MRLWLFAVFVLALGTIAGACTPPCEDLANTICDCDEDPNQRQSCRAQVLTDATAIKVTAADNRRCTEILKTCDKSCIALRRRDRAACGFNIEP